MSGREDIDRKRPGTLSAPPETEAPSRAHVVLALLSVWILWGSTYYAIRIAVEALPPFLMAGTRFVLAGVILGAFALSRGAAWPRREHWGPALVCGALLMLGSNGLVCWAETRVDSSVAAVIIACVPLWMLLFDWGRTNGVRPPSQALAGVALGIAGVALLSAPDPEHPLDALGLLALFGATISWSVGSLYARSARLPESQLVSTAMQMLCGGALQLVAGLVLGEGGRLDLARVGPEHVAALAWLVVAGSLVGFTAYLWLLKHTAPAVATSYAFVNPLVAMALGVGLLGERLGPRTVMATALILAAVALVVVRRRAPAALSA